MHEYSNIRATLEEIRALIVLHGNLKHALLLLELARISLVFIPDSVSKKSLETEINRLEKGLKQPPFLFEKVV